MQNIKNYIFQIFNLCLFLIVDFFFNEKFENTKIFFLYILFLIIYIVISKSFIKFSSSYDLEIKPKNFWYLFSIFLYSIIAIVTQNYYLNYEQITWDVASYLVASQDIGNGYIPFEASWESKGPLNYYVFHVLNLISLKNYLYFRLINDLVILFISLLIFKIVNKQNSSFIVSFASGLLFIGLVSKDWYVSEFTEIYCIFILAICIYLKEKTSNKNIILISLLLSINSLINQGSILFILPFFWWIISKNFQNKNYKESKYFLAFMSIPQLIAMSIYIDSGLIDIYFANYITIPLKYSGISQSTFYEVLVWLKEFHKFSNFLIIALIIIFVIFVMENIKKIKNLFNDFYFQCLLVSIFYYFVGSHNFYHHLFYLLFFICFLLNKIQSVEFKILIISLIIIGTSSITFNLFENSFSNLKNLEATQNNYPLYQLSQEIDSYFPEKNYSILALDYVLVLHYLEKQNYSYIIHPTNHFEDYIENTLIELGYIDKNEILKLVNEGPDVILCNDTLTIRGQVKNFSSFNCDNNPMLDNYTRLETGKYYHDFNIELYKDRSKVMYVYIKNSK